MNRPRVLLADDHRMVAEGLKRLLSDDCDLVECSRGLIGKSCRQTDSRHSVGVRGFHPGPSDERLMVGPIRAALGRCQPNKQMGAAPLFRAASHDQTRGGVVPQWPELRTDLI